MTAMDSPVFIMESRLVRFPPRFIRCALVFADVGALPPLAAYGLVQRPYRRQHIADKLFDPLFFYCFTEGILVGARLGGLHVLRTGLFPCPPLGNDSTYAADGQRLGVHGYAPD